MARRDEPSTATLPGELAAGPVVLRRWREAHLDALMAAIQASVEELRPWMPWVGDITREAEREFLRRSEKAFEAGTEFGFGVFGPESDVVVGGCGLHTRRAPDTGEIGYWIESSRAGHGYATCAAAALTEAAFAYVPRLARIVIACDVENRASARVAEKLGYSRTDDEPRRILAPGQSGRGMVWVLERHSTRNSGLLSGNSR